MSYKKDSIIYLIYIGLLITILVGAPYFFLNRFLTEKNNNKSSNPPDSFSQFLINNNIISLLSLFLKLTFVFILTSILIIFFFI
jgi:putative flippase GtrA